ncbi:MAG: ATP synthase F1 subunit gamma [Bacteroidales bacterium]|nr:ATP synthase F1 subunit gamma [Bacteroidales bacterium]
MASLKDIKSHIGSVKSTLKITSAMKLVASAKLRKAQQAIESMRPYRDTLSRILSQLGTASLKREIPSEEQSGKPSAAALVIISSNSSLCGGFNANVIREAKTALAALEAEGMTVRVFALGRKACDAFRKSGYASVEDCSSLVSKAEYGSSAEFADRLVKEYLDGTFDKVELVYNHFVSNAVQKVTGETFLPFGTAGCAAEDIDEDAFILEPGRRELLEALVPKVLRLSLYTAILDSAAAEHAARTVAMQTASDNAEEILRQLTLEYNKSRQQKITAEILDMIGGSMQ